MIEFIDYIQFSECVSITSMNCLLIACDRNLTYYIYYKDDHDQSYLEMPGECLTMALIYIYIFIYITA